MQHCCINYYICIVKYIIVIAIVLFPAFLFSQKCNITITGKVVDNHDNEVLEYASVVLDNNIKFVYSDINGFFKIDAVCAGTYHITINHLGCEQVQLYTTITKDTFLTIEMEHHAELLETITVSEKRKSNISNSTPNVLLKKELLDKKSGESLGKIIESVAGVNNVETGNGISKPMIHGLFGNRIDIINNDFAIKTQNWGIEHAPEIDPFSVNDITIIKGASALKYSTKAMAGAIILNDEHLPTDKHVHGSYNFAGFLNGFKFSNNLKLEGGISKTDIFKWRIQGSYTKAGDTKTPNYYLTNTGMESSGASAQFGIIKSKFTTTLNYKFYYLKTAILAGSHIGNTTDLEEAFQRKQPFGTLPYFSYNINKPFQSVFHHSLNLRHKHYLKNNGELELAYNFQFNNRKEYDIRRSSQKPSLFLKLLSNNLTVDYKNELKKWKYNLGFQYEYTSNYNSLDLNVKPLIPNYIKNKLSPYFINTLELDNITFDLGLRYELEFLLAKYYENNILKSPKYIFSNISSNIGFNYAIFKDAHWRFSFAYVKRSPEVNELYSNGLHHGAAAIERGDSTIKNEQLISVSTGFTYSKPNKISVEISPYYQYFFNYIDLVLQQNVELTIRGAFPVYNYSPSKAQIWGFDFGMQTHVYQNLVWKLKSAIVRGKNLDNKNNLSFMPADYLENALQYSFPIKKHEMQLELGVKNVWQQVRTPQFDFIESPKGYTLLNAAVGGKIRIKKTSLTWQLEADNILNTTYRNYLNRWRYYADELGTQLVLRTKIDF